MSEIPGSITKVMNYGTIEPEAEIFAKCLECMGNVINKVLLERKSLNQTTKVGVYTGVLGSIWLWSRLKTMFTDLKLNFFIIVLTCSISHRFYNL